jgi:hypothetical protein
MEKLKTLALLGVLSVIVVGLIILGPATAKVEDGDGQPPFVACLDEDTVCSGFNLYECHGGTWLLKEENNEAECGYLPPEPATTKVLSLFWHESSTVEENTIGPSSINEYSFINIDPPKRVRFLGGSVSGGLIYSQKWSNQTGDRLGGSGGGVPGTGYVEIGFDGGGFENFALPLNTELVFDNVNRILVGASAGYPRLNSTSIDGQDNVASYQIEMVASVQWIEE